MAGPNGAGKTSLAPFLLGDKVGEFPFINADAIASGLSAFDPEGVAIEAGRIMLRRLHELAEKKKSFAFESTLAARSYASPLSRLRQRGYEVHLIFVWLRSVDLAIERVAERVRRGGHAIPTKEIRRRYLRGILNLFELYIPLVDTWAIYDNSEENNPLLIVTGGAKSLLSVTRPDLWQLLLESRPQK